MQEREARAQEREARLHELQAHLLEKAKRLEEREAHLNEQQAGLEVLAGHLEERERELNARDVEIGDKRQSVEDGERLLRENHARILATAGALTEKMSNYHEKAARLGLDVGADDDFKLVLAAPQPSVEERRWVTFDDKRNSAYPPQSGFLRDQHCRNPLRAADGLRRHAVQDSIPSRIAAPAGRTAEHPDRRLATRARQYCFAPTADCIQVAHQSVGTGATGPRCRGPGRRVGVGRQLEPDRCDGSGAWDTARAAPRASNIDREPQRA